MRQMDNLSVIIFGASGHAKVVIDVARKAGFLPVAVLDDNASCWGMTLSGVPVVGGRESLAGLLVRGVDHAVVAIGKNRARMAVAEWLAERGVSFPVVIHPAAVIDSSAFLGPGTVLMAGAIVNADVHIGAHCIINTGASVDHDCFLGDGMHLAPGARLCGNVTVGQMVLIGVGASVIPGVSLGAGAVVGAGAAVVTHVSTDATVIGVPARVLVKGLKCR